MAREAIGATLRALRSPLVSTPLYLKLALAVYPDAKVDISDDGLILYPSRPPVLERG